MLRNLNATYAGKRILASPYVGILASQIAAETSAGDHGPGILYNESVDPVYAGKYLRAWVTNPPAVGSLIVEENGEIEAVDLPDGVHTYNYDLIVDDAYNSASYFEVRVGVVDATAAGATLTGTATLTPGSAAGESNASAPGATLTGTASIEPGAASGGASAAAPGATLTGTASLDPGAATGVSAGTAPGATLTGSATLEPGSATGNQAATAPGVTLTGSATLTPGAATATNPDATAPGVVLTGSATLVPGVAGDADVVYSGPASWWVRPPKRVWIVKPPRRTWRVKASAKGGIMPLPEKDPGEIKTVTFDFSDDAESIVSSVVSAYAHTGLSDNSPDEVLGNKSEVGALVNQRVKAGHNGTGYALRCEATDADGEVHVAVALLPVSRAAPI